jgi:hypothetical protein
VTSHPDTGMEWILKKKDIIVDSVSSSVSELLFIILEFDTSLSSFAKVEDVATFGKYEFRVACVCLWHNIYTQPRGQL